MSPEKEAIGRVVIAEFEVRQKTERSNARAARMRFAVQVVISIGVVIMGILFVRQDLVFSSRDWAFLTCTLMTISGWSNYRLRESITELRVELDRLKAAIDEKKTYQLPLPNEAQ
jgi:hypothetical protein